MSIENLLHETLKPSIDEVSLEHLQPFLKETDIPSKIEYLNKVEGFSECKWKELSPHERLDTLREYEARLAEIQGRESRIVQPHTYYSDGKCVTLGHYDPNYPSVININIELLSRSELRLQAFHTLAHEGRHAFQHDVVRGLLNYDPEVTAYWKANWQHYLSASRFGFEFYKSQPIELDANSFAGKIVDGLIAHESNDVHLSSLTETGSPYFDAGCISVFNKIASQI